jgi:methyltransferase-like protein/trans-aconitate methyltransferase
MSSTSPTSYDELPYADNCFPYSHPDNLAVVATLYGLEPPALATCRVLELGCAGGGNLIPMALTLPSGTFVGVDLSARQVAAGQETIAALGLKNIDLKAISITNIDRSFGTFDYILCHGVYSWVPEPVREKILAICAENLTPNGVAYISYNTYPGWHQRGLVREILNYHVGRTTGSPRDRVESARVFLETLVRAVPRQDTSYARILQSEMEFLRGVNDSYLFHEHLEETNRPCYVHEFCDRAAGHGLRYLGEADSEGLIEALPPDSRAVLEQWSGDRVSREQYLDFLCNRTFRRSLICHNDVQPATVPSASRIIGMFVSASARPQSENPEITSDKVETFVGRRAGAVLSTNHSLVKAVLTALYEARPRALTLTEIKTQARSLLGRDFENVGQGPTVADILLKAHLGNMASLHVHPPILANDIGDHPEVSPLARLQSRTSERVTSLSHRTVELEPFDRAILPWLDGTRDSAQVLDAVVNSVLAGDFRLEQDGQQLLDREQIRKLMGAELELSLARIAEAALMMHSTNNI